VVLVNHHDEIGGAYLPPSKPGETLEEYGKRTGLGSPITIYAEGTDPAVILRSYTVLVTDMSAGEEGSVTWTSVMAEDPQDAARTAGMVPGELWRP
jgi:hypothetical protein